MKLITNTTGTPSNEFLDYRQIFSQPRPRYVRRDPGSKAWKTVRRDLFDKVLQGHLNQEYSIGCVSKYYPEYMILDFDDTAIEDVEEQRDLLGMDDSNSMLYSTESASSYHVLARPVYHESPPSANLLQGIVGPYAKHNGFDLFPHPKKTIRLPFGPHQTLLDTEQPLDETWTQKLFWFNKLDEYDLSDIPYHQLPLNFQPAGRQGGEIAQDVSTEGGEYLEAGLQQASSREWAQFCIIYHLWRQNTHPASIKRIVWSWLKSNHNGFSKTYPSNPHEALNHIERQVAIVVSKYHFSGIYPDEPHKKHYGYICQGDMEKIIEISAGNIPRIKFLFNVLKYSYPRRHRTFVNVHRDKLYGWARSYIKYLGELDEKGIVKRGSAYQVSKFSKDLKLNWKYKDSSKAVLYAGRSIDTFDSAVRVLFEPQYFRGLLRAFGASKQAAHKVTKDIFSGSTKEHT